VHTERDDQHHARRWASDVEEGGGTGHEGNAALEVGGLDALLVVERGAIGAHQVVEEVYAPVERLAGVARALNLELYIRKRNV
jgi:hypothetical protein